MSESGKRQRDEGRADTFKRKVRIVPLYSECTSGGCVFDNGSVLTLPCSLGRRNLAELWWKYCPKGCHAERPQAKPCTRFCSAVRRKSHRTLLSREIVTIDASGSINLRAKNSEIIRWSRERCGTYIRDLKRLVSGENYVLMIGDFLEQPEKPWMSFRIGMCPVVTPDRFHDITKEKEGEISQTRRRLFHYEHGTTYSQHALVDSGETETSHRSHFTQLQKSCNTNHAKGTSLRFQQFSSGSIYQSDSSAGDKLDTQEEGHSAKPPGNATRSLVSPPSRVNTKDKLDVYHENHFDQPLQPCQLIFSDQPDIDPRTSPNIHRESISNFSRESIGSQESALSLPRGETQNTRDDRIFFSSESPPMEGSNFQDQSLVELPFTGKCRDWSFDDWVKLSHQNLASGFGRRVVDLVLSKNRGAAEGSDLQLPTLFDDSTIGVPLNMIDKKPVFGGND